MKVLDILNSPWAILPAKLLEIGDIYQRRVRGEKSEYKAEIADKEDPELAYQVVNGVAIVSAHGVIAKRMNFFMKMSGGVSTQILHNNFMRALHDPDVKALILDIDSPGGTVDGTQVMANAIYEARGKKPIYSFIDGCGASAAYWLASAADKVYISDDTAVVGSIGVVATHTDYSKADEMAGVKITEITAGKYKRIASDTEPLSKEGRASIQEEVDYIYGVFVNDVARNRGVSVDVVLKDMADGRIFLGKQAIESGLADGMSSIPALVDALFVETRESAGGEEDAARPAAGVCKDVYNQPIRVTFEDLKAAGATVVTVLETEDPDDIEDPDKDEPVADVPAAAEPVDESATAPKSEPAPADTAPDALPESGSGDANTTTPLTREGEDAMSMLLEQEVREALRLGPNATKDDILGACRAAAATQDIVMAGGDQAVAMFDHMQLLEKQGQLLKTIAEKDAAYEQLKTEHAKKERQAHADLLVKEAREAGKVPPSLEAWAKKQAYNDPEQFAVWSANAHRVVSLNRGEGASPNESVAPSVAEQFNVAVEMRAQEYRTANKPVPPLGALQLEVAEKNPSLYAEYSNDMRGVSR